MAASYIPPGLSSSSSEEEQETMADEFPDQRPANHPSTTVKGMRQVIWAIKHAPSPTDDERLSGYHDVIELGSRALGRQVRKHLAAHQGLVEDEVEFKKMAGHQHLPEEIPTLWKDQIDDSLTNMTTTISSLPYELLSAILKEAACLNAQGNRFTWTQSRELNTIHGLPSKDVVYRDPYLLLRKTGDLFGKYPTLATSVRRIFFDGYYSTETSGMIINILQYCNRLIIVSLPWTMLRYGSEDDWSRILNPRDNGTVLSSLELLAVDLKKVQLSEPARQKDDKTLDSAKVNLGHLRRLKISGSSNLSPVTDNDLVAMSRTARLVDLHITNTTCLTSQGLLALVRASKDTLRVLEHAPLVDPGFKEPELSANYWGNHMCDEIMQCPQLRSLAICLPTICSDLFRGTSNYWMGDVHVKAAGICKQAAGSLETPVDAQLAIFEILHSVRRFIQTQQAKSIELNILISLGQFIFEPSKNLVHPNFLMGSIDSAGSWPSIQYSANKSYGNGGW
ncbi:MAG: hypothetical protein Q9212_000974, partial [Teloschistes hypoglaucus]